MEMNKLYLMAEEYEKFSCKSKLRKYKVGEVIDEEKSVRWNREEVERLNKLHEDEVKALNTKKNLLYTTLIKAIKEYIMKNTDVSEPQATKIWEYLYSHYHAYGIEECLANLNELLLLFR